jgi:hypothetical protein
MALKKFGEKTQSIFLNDFENDKLMLGFTVSAGVSVLRGQPVILSNDGTVKPAATDGSEAHKVIGYSVHNGDAGEEITIGMRGYAVLWAKANAVQNAGPALYAGMASSPNGAFCKYATAGVNATTMNGWAIDDATIIGETIRVVLK